MRRTILLAITFALAIAGHASAAHPEAAQTIVLASENVPEGVEVARHYMAARGIPEENLCLVRSPAAEEVTREEFNQTLWGPLRTFLARWEGRLDVALPDGRLRLATDNRHAKYLVPVYGIPIKIKGYEQVATMYLSTAAAVDSELAMLPGGGHKLVGGLENPYFGQNAPFGPPLDGMMILVTRLDGPTPEIAKGLVDDAIWAETHGGLKGHAYVDTRGLTKGPYAEGDEWLRNAAEMLRRAGLETEVDIKPEVMPLNHPMPDAAVYLGWYTETAVGPMVKTDFRFVRGAIAYHLQSFTGAAIRDAKTHWVGPLLLHGACVTAGAVYEPFLSGTPHIDIMMARLLQGYSWGEAAYMSELQLSWQMCFIGDPLYRPFGRRQ
ncbi:MAG: TIGR03790 family protein [Planctomycetota bacterium]|nr:TIGR03790 family protein [Planctomycetota bacterium]